MAKVDKWIKIGELIGKVLKKLNEVQKDGKITTNEAFQLLVIIIEGIHEILSVNTGAP